MRTMKFKEFFMATEARRMVRDPNKPVLTQNMLGWNVYFYDLEKEEFSNGTQKIKDRLYDIKAALDKLTSQFQSDAALQNFADEAMWNERSRSVTADSILGSSGDKQMEDLNGGERKEIFKFISEDLDDAVLTSLSISYDIYKLLSIDKLIDTYTPAADATVEQLCREAFRHVFQNLPRHIQGIIQNATDPAAFSRRNAADPASIIKNAGPMIQQSLAMIQQAGVRNSHKVPIRVMINHEQPQIGSSDERAAGTQHSGTRMTSGRKPVLSWEKNQQSTQFVNLNLVGTEDQEWFNDVLVHEIGHVVYTTSPELQKAVQEMAYSMPAPSTYGTTNYKYKGEDKTSIHHKTGNEWFAEMFKTVVTGQNPGFTQQQIMQFKKALAGANNTPHPHAGIGYRLGQNTDSYQFPDTHQPVVQPRTPDINLPALPAEPPLPNRRNKRTERLDTKMIPGADDYEM